MRYLQYCIMTYVHLLPKAYNLSQVCEFAKYLCLRIDLWKNWSMKISRHCTLKKCSTYRVDNFLSLVLWKVVQNIQNCAKYPELCKISGTVGGDAAATQERVRPIVATIPVFAKRPGRICQGLLAWTSSCFSCTLRHITVWGMWCSHMYIHIAARN